MKVTVAVNGRFLTQLRTGVQRYAIELLSEVCANRAAGCRFICFVPPGKVSVDIPGLEVVRDAHSFGSGVLWQQMRLPVLARKARADILWSPCNIAPVMWPNKQLVTVFDGSVYAGAEWFDWKFRLYYRSVFNFYKHAVAQILTCSEFSKNEISRYMGISQDNIHVIYGAISPSFARTSRSSPVEGRYVLSLGSRDPRKNIPALIRCWDSLSPGIKCGRKLVIAGGYQSTFAKENIRGKISQDILFTGYLDDKVLPALYSHADCFIYPSLYEGFGLPPLEAMSCGCPVITSRCASLPEVCGDAALYVDPRDQSSISEALSKVMADKSIRDRLVQNGYRNVSRFRWADSAVKVMRVLEMML